jgi:ribose transport system substrate-binding protein
MTKLKKLIFITFAVMIIACLLPSCSEHSSDAVVNYLSEVHDDSKSLDDDLMLAWSPDDRNDEYYKKLTQGFEDYCTEHKYTALIADPSGSREEQYSEFENWIAMSVDAIAAAPVDPQHLETIALKAQEKGIITAGVFKKLLGADFNYTLDEYDLGFMIGQNALRWIDERLDGRANVVLMLNNSDEFLKLRGDGIRDAFDGTSGIRIVAIKSVDSVPDAKVAVDSVLSTYLGINVVVCITDEYAIGVTEVTNDLDIDDNNFYVGGAGYTDEAVRMMNEAGSYMRSSIDLSPYETGWMLGEMMATAVVNGIEQDTKHFEPKTYWQNKLNWN